MLELEPRYLKAVMRRAQALEALEKYEDALDGVCECVFVCACMRRDFSSLHEADIPYLESYS